MPAGRYVGSSQNNNNWIAGSTLQVDTVALNGTHSLPTAAPASPPSCQPLHTIVPPRLGSEWAIEWAGGRFTASRDRRPGRLVLLPDGVLRPRRPGAAGPPMMSLWRPVGPCEQDTLYIQMYVYICINIFVPSSGTAQGSLTKLSVCLSVCFALNRSTTTANNR